MFIISDTHFCHDNIIEYSNRPFDDISQMNETIIEHWNKIVSPQDTILHLGDVGMYWHKLREIVARLNGHKLLVRGNHDWNASRMTELGFECVTTTRSSSFRFPYQDRQIICTHRPSHMPLIFCDGGPSPVRLCGHVHNNLPRWIPNQDILNMSVEWWSFQPTHIEDVIRTYDKYYEHS